MWAVPASPWRVRGRSLFSAQTPLLWTRADVAVLGKKRPQGSAGCSGGCPSLCVQRQPGTDPDRDTFIGFCQKFPSLCRCSAFPCPTERDEGAEPLLSGVPHPDRPGEGDQRWSVTGYGSSAAGYRWLLRDGEEKSFGLCRTLPFLRNPPRRLLRCWGSALSDFHQGALFFYHNKDNNGHLKTSNRRKCSPRPLFMGKKL